MVNKVRAPRRPRGPTRMSRVHERNPEEKKVISLNDKGQAISQSEGDIAELSNFLGTLARDNVSLTYINWHVVPDQLKQKLWEYTLVNSYLIHTLNHFQKLCSEVINLIMSFMFYIL